MPGQMAGHFLWVKHKHKKRPEGGRYRQIESD
jgi:hypothetical protein